MSSGPRKGPTSGPSQPNPSPGQTKTPLSSLAQMGMKELNAQIHQSITEAMTQVVQNTLPTLIMKAMEPLQEKFDNFTKQVTSQLDEFKKQTLENKQELNKLNEATNRNEVKVDEVDQQLQDLKLKCESMDNSLLTLEMEKASNLLRFQNIPEVKEEIIKEIMVEALSSFLDLDSTVEIEKDIEYVFRRNSAVARKAKTPREVHVRFSNRSIRDKILDKAKSSTLNIQGAEILVLCDIPWPVREKRRGYQQLASLLRTSEILYRWQYPEGISFMYKNKRQSLTSIPKVEDFLARFGHELGYQDEERSESEGESEGESQAETDSITFKSVKDKKQKKYSPLNITTRLQQRKEEEHKNKKNGQEDA